MVKEIKDIEYETVIKEGKVVIDCYAPWCGPCKMISPIIDKFAEEIKHHLFEYKSGLSAMSLSKNWGRHRGFVYSSRC